MICKEIPNMKPYAINRYGIVININTKEIIKQFTNGGGYLTVNLTPVGFKRKSYFVHRLVCMTYTPTNNLRLHVNHKDLVRTNNYYKNLEWCTQKENARHSAYLNVNYKQTPILARNIYTKIIKQYDSMFDCAKSLNVSRDTIIYRVNSMFGSIFDGYQFKKVIDNRPWIELDNIEVISKQKEYMKLVYLRKFGTAIEFESQREAAKYLKISETTMTKFINLRHSFKFNGYVISKRYDKNWDKELPEFYTKLTPRFRVTIGVNINTFATLKGMSDFLNIKPTTMAFRLSKNNSSILIMGEVKIEIL